MSYRINICDLSLDKLNGVCLAKISQFARKLEQFDGTVVQLKDDHIIGEIVHIAKTTTSDELKQLYGEIKQAIKTHINSPQFDKFKSEFAETTSTQVMLGNDEEARPDNTR